MGLGVDGELGVERVWDRRAVIQSEEGGRRNRDTFEAWKKGVVPPLKGEWEQVTVGSQGWREAGLYEGESRAESGTGPNKSAPGTTASIKERDPSEN